MRLSRTAILLVVAPLADSPGDFRGTWKALLPVRAAG